MFKQYVASDSLVYSGVRFVVAKSASLDSLNCERALELHIVYINAIFATLNERGALRDGLDISLNPSTGNGTMFFHSRQTESTQLDSLTAKQRRGPNSLSSNSGAFGFENHSHVSGYLIIHWILKHFSFLD